MNRAVNSIIVSAFLALLLLLAACAGGGTTGTGVKVYEGNVRTIDAKVLANVKVTILETGEETVTDPRGDFVIETSSGLGHLTFVLEGRRFKVSATVDNESVNDSRVSLQLKVDRASNAVQVSEFDVRALMLDKCAQYFDNGVTIKQAQTVPEDTLCTVRVRVLTGDVPRRNIPVTLQHSPCGTETGWQDEKTTVTGDGVMRGIAYLSFNFKSTTDYCKYRIVAPYDYEKYKPVIYPIETFGQQHRRKQR